MTRKRKWKRLKADPRPLRSNRPEVAPSIFVGRPASVIRSVLWKIGLSR